MMNAPPGLTPDLLASHLDSLEDGILVFDPGLRVVFANAAAGRLLGRSRDELLAATLSDLFAAADIERLRAALDDGSNGPEAAFEAALGPSGHPAKVRAYRSTGSALVQIRPIREEDQGEALARALERLHESEERYRIVASTASDALVSIDASSTILFANPACERIFGYTPEELVGKSLSILMPERFRASHRAGIARYLATGERRIPWQGLELPGLHSSGREITLEVSFGEYAHGGKHVFTGVLRDVSARRRAQRLRDAQLAVTTVLAEARSAEEALPLVLGAICEATGWEFGEFWYPDPESGALALESYWAAPDVDFSEFIDTSRDAVFARGIGLPGRAWEGTEPVWIVDITSDPNFPRAAAAIRAGLRRAFGFPVRHRGEVSAVLACYSRGAGEADEALLDVVAALGSQIGVFLERVRAGEEREASLHREKAARTELERAARAKDQFLATVSHELRTPLNAILGWMRLLRSGRLDAEMFERGLDTIDRNVQAQAQLIEDLLDVSRIVAGKLRLEVRSVDLAAIVEAAIESARPAAQAKSIWLRSMIDPDAGFVIGDAGRLQQVVWNLLSNAIKFTPRGGQIEATLARVGSWVEVRVADTGRGIGSDLLPYVFEQFQQADGSASRTHSGLGLGLSIAKNLVELHGGSITAESAGESRGAVFTVRLPLSGARVVQEPWPLAERAARNEIGPPALSGAKVLIVEDEEDTREMLGVFLGHCGAIVRGEPTAADGLRALLDWQPDVLISDIGLPKEDGYALIARVRALDERSGGNVPAIALTAYARPEDRMRALSSGFQMHVAKPVEPVELAMLIDNVLKMSGRR